MPLVNIIEHGDFTRSGGSFSRYDRKFINSDAGKARIQQAFCKFRVPLILHFINLREPVNLDEHLKQSGLTTYNHLFDNFHVRIPSTRDALTVVLTNNEGSYKLPLTPWMVAHRIAHALSISYNIEFATANRAYYDLLTQLASSTGRAHYIIGRHLGTSRAFRKRRIVNYGEAVIEFAAQLYITGRVQLKTYQELIAEVPPAAELVNAEPIDQEITLAAGDIAGFLNLQLLLAVNHIFLL